MLVLRYIHLRTCGLSISSFVDRRQGGRQVPCSRVPVLTFSVVLLVLVCCLYMTSSRKSCSARSTLEVSLVVCSVLSCLTSYIRIRLNVFNGIVHCLYSHPLRSPLLLDFYTFLFNYRPVRYRCGYPYKRPSTECITDKKHTTSLSEN